MEGINFIANIEVVCSCKQCFFSQREINFFRSRFGGESGVMRNGTMVRMSESSKGLRRINFILDLCENRETLDGLTSWVLCVFGTDREYPGEGVIICSEYGKEEVISGDQSFFIVSMRENSRGNPDNSYEAPACVSGSYCIA
jgi:hypothetical protein